MLVGELGAKRRSKTTPVEHRATLEGYSSFTKWAPGFSPRPPLRRNELKSGTERAKLHLPVPTRTLPKMKKLIIATLLIALTYASCRDTPAAWRGVPAGQDPVQTSDHLPKAFFQGKYLITPLARYSVTAVVLSRDRYRFDPGAEIAPVDLALGWGPMSIADNINQLRISQSGRFYEYSWPKEPPMDPHDIVTHSANTHCLPADDSTRRQLLAVRRHEVVTLEGYLVEVQMPDGGHWRSSLTREDSGGGACEVLWVTTVSHRKM